MSLILTRMQNLRPNGNIDKYEFRGSRYGALDFFMRDGEQPGGIMTEEIRQAARISNGRKIEIPVINYNGSIAIGNTRPLVINDSENKSQFVVITFVTYSWGFTIVPALYMNNEIQIQKDFEKKFEGYMYKFYSIVDKACYDTLYAARSQKIGDPLTYTFTATGTGEPGFRVLVPWEDRVNIIGDLNPLMYSNDFYSQLHLIGGVGLESQIRKLAQYGLYNQVNKQLEYNDKILHFTNCAKTGGTSDFTSFLAVNQGTCGLAFRQERECLMGTRIADGHEWGIAMMPGVDIPMGTYYYEQAGNYYSTDTDAMVPEPDMTRNKKEFYGFAVDIAYICSYNSAPTTLASPILNIGIKKQSTTSSTK